MKRVMELQALTFVFVLVAVGLALVQIHDNRRLAIQGRNAHAALCAFRGDLARRILSAEKFVDTHPQGFAGLSRR